ncbi:hypothetical protein BJV74DRAFT_820790, partial [Russula compacta]
MPSMGLLYYSCTHIQTTEPSNVCVKQAYDFLIWMQFASRLHLLFLIASNMLTHMMITTRQCQPWI